MLHPETETEYYATISPNKEMWRLEAAVDNMRGGHLTDGQHVSRGREAI